MENESSAFISLFNLVAIKIFLSGKLSPTRCYKRIEININQFVSYKVEILVFLFFEF